MTKTVIEHLRSCLNDIGITDVFGRVTQGFKKTEKRSSPMSLPSRMAIVVGLASALVVSVCAQAAPMLPVNGIDRPSMTIQVAGGCGPNAWRGPWGHCRSTPFYGRLPNGYYQPEPAQWNGCPEGYWRGPWGHCRNTPYHGRLPGGGWK